MPGVVAAIAHHGDVSASVDDAQLAAADQCYGLLERRAEWSPSRRPATISPGVLVLQG